MVKFVSEEKRIKWQGLIEQQKQSDLSAERWCQQNQINFRMFRYWKAKLFPKQLEKSSFTELNVRLPEAISLQARGIHIRISRNCDSKLRRQVITLFAEMSC